MNNKYCANPTLGDSCVTITSCDEINSLNPTQQQDCDKYFTGCLYINSKCIIQGDCETYT